MKLCFSSLGCPQYTFDEIIATAKQNHFDGIELRTVCGTTDLWTIPDFSEDNLPIAKQKCKAAGLEIVVVGTSVAFSDNDAQHVQTQMENLHHYAKIAAGLGCSYLRVFGGVIPEGQTIESSLVNAMSGYREAQKIAAQYGVTLLVETHDDFSTSAALLPLIEPFGGKIGVIWDILHPYRFGEAMDVTSRALAPYIKHVHIKDSCHFSAETFDIALPGTGILPVGEAISLLKASGYEGYLSFEWEKHWHPEIQDPEIAIPAFRAWIAQFL